MPRKREMKFRAKDQGGRWRGIYRGKYFHRQKRAGETVEESYVRVLPEFRRWKETVDGEAEAADPDRRAWEGLIRNVVRMMDGCAADDTTENRDRWRTLNALRHSYRALLDAGIPCAHTPEEVEADPGCILLADGFPDGPPPEEPPPWEVAAAVARPSPAGKTVGWAVGRFVKEKTADANGGQISQGRLGQIEGAVGLFLQHVGEDEPLARIGNGTLSGYRAELLEKVAAGEPSARTAHDRMQAAGQFVKWCVSEGLIERPAILDSPERLRITAGAKAIVTFTDGELRTVYDAANKRLRLFVLLGLNCGMTQSDIGQLRRDEVDWAAGRIVRQRTKTRKHHGGSVPTVDYPLWPETARLLRDHRAPDDQPLALLTTTGRPLWADGSVTKPIDSAWKRLAAKMGDDYPGKSFKILRKTAATRMETEHPQFGELFLGHAPATTKAKSYAKYDQAGFDEAVRWLGSQWAFASGVTSGGPAV